ncbi:hypothetical protein INR49_006439 [Caranx melampygus]|nr:hypothetical protein INR49_006439 [Caranx melampygus]
MVQTEEEQSRVTRSESSSSIDDLGAASSRAPPRSLPASPASITAHRAEQRQTPSGHGPSADICRLQPRDQRLLPGEIPSRAPASMDVK